MAILDFLSKDKRIVRCYRCNAPTSASDIKVINGTNYCPTCYQRIMAAQSRQKTPQPDRTSGRTPDRTSDRSAGRTPRSFDDKYGKTPTSTTPTKPVKPVTPTKPVKPTNPVKPSGCPAQILDVKRVLDDTQTKYREEHNGDRWEIITGFSGSAKNYTLKFISMEGETNMAIRIFGIVSAERSQYRKVYPVLNKLQDTYRFLRFTLDTDGDVNVEYDIPNCTNGAGMVALEMIVRITKIMDEVYPDLKRAAYS